MESKFKKCVLFGGGDDFFWSMNVFLFFLVASCFGS